MKTPATTPRATERVTTRKKNAPGAGRPTLAALAPSARELAKEAAAIDAFLSANEWIAAAAIGERAGLNKTLVGRICRGLFLTEARVDALAGQLEKLTTYTHAYHTA